MSTSFFERHRLPKPLTFYSGELQKLLPRGQWAQACCPFHNDRNPSLSVNIRTGSFKCFSCGVRGGDILDFQRQRYGQSFKEAAQSLGAWREGA